MYREEKTNSLTLGHIIYIFKQRKWQKKLGHTSAVCVRWERSAPFEHRHTRSYMFCACTCLDQAAGPLTARTHTCKRRQRYLINRAAGNSPDTRRRPPLPLSFNFYLRRVNAKNGHTRSVRIIFRAQCTRTPIK